MTHRLSRPLLAAASAAVLLTPAAALAETLAEAMALAYETNPTLQSQRALQRQTDETYVQARAGWRPTVTGTAAMSYSQNASPVNNNTVTIDRATASASLVQPLFTSGRVASAVDAADATIRAGRESLRTTEANVMQQVVQAYQDVLRDQQILAIRQQSVDVLLRSTEETAARFEAGLLTRTDVARAEAQLAASRAQLASARATLQNSRATYAAVIGRQPGQLETPTVLPGLPANIDQAFEVAEDSNPTLRRAMLVEEASRARIAQAKAQRGPTVTLNGNYGRAGTAAPFGPFGQTLGVSVNASVPIFTGGVLASQIRGATEQNTSDRILIEQTRRTMLQTLTTAWNQMLAAQASILSNEEGVRAATIAFEGAQEQYRVGISTTLDVLLAQDAMRAAQLALVQSQRDEYVAQAQVLSAIGRLELGALAENAPLYDPADNFNRIKNKGSLPWDDLLETIDLNKGADTAKAGRAPEVAMPGAPTVMRQGVAPQTLTQAEQSLKTAEPSPTAPLPRPGSSDQPR